MSDQAFVAAVGLSVVIDRSVLLASTSFTVGSGRALGVTGANGSGKTTLLRVLAGRMSPSNGTVRIAGAKPDDHDPVFRARLAALLGLPPLARDLTLREHMVLVAASWGLSIEESQQRAEGLLDELGILSLASRFTHELSSGQTQVFAVALTLARPFEVLLLDEPEQHLDADRLGMVGRILRTRVDRGATIVMASHNSTLVEQVADDVVALTEGVYEPGD